MFQISQYFLDRTPQTNQNSESEISWILPIPQNQKADVESTIINIPESLSSSLTINQEDVSEINFFNNDLKAVQKYAQVLPVEAISNLNKEEQEEKIEEFNTFFKENYIDNQAFLLDPQDEQEYEDYIRKNGFMTWNDFVIQKLNKKTLPEKVDFQDFLLKKKEERKEIYKQINTNLPANNIVKPGQLSGSSFNTDTLSNFETLPFQSKINSNPSEITSTIEKEVPVQAQRNYDSFQQEDFQSFKSQIKNTQNLSLQDPKISIFYEAKGENKENKENKENSQIIQSQAENAINQYLPQQNLNRAIVNSQNQAVAQAETDAQNRQKGVNYGKIIGLASGGALAGFSSLATMLSILTSSS